MRVMIIKSKHYINLLLLLACIILQNCKLQEPIKNHGILFLENRSKQLNVNISNKNDVIRLIGNPHTKTINQNDWIYIERVLTKGSYHKLGQHIVKKNNVLILTFDKYGILNNKEFLNKNDLNKLKFSKKITKNNLSQKSFVQSFLASIKSKMYRNR